MKEYSKKDVPIEFLTRIKPYVEEAMQQLTYQSFHDHLTRDRDIQQESDWLKQNDWIHKTYVLLLVMLERYSEALVQANLLLGKDYRGRGAIEQIEEECKQIKALLEQDPLAAKALVMEWELQMKSELGLA